MSKRVRAGVVRCPQCNRTFPLLYTHDDGTVEETGERCPHAWMEDGHPAMTAPEYYSTEQHLDTQGE